MNIHNQASSIPVVLLAGFLGSGKTTLLSRLLEACKEKGMKPAVIMNELGEINLESERLGSEVPLKEMLSGCICCTMKGDLTGELLQLVRQEAPDLILVEATGAANAFELIEGIMDAAIYGTIHLASVVTVVDGPALLTLRGSRRSMKLMEEGIRCATRLVLNKSDKLHPEELVQVQQQIRGMNAHASLVCTSHARVDEEWIGDALAAGTGAGLEPGQLASAREAAGEEPSPGLSHDHLMAMTYYPARSYDSQAFESMLHSLPDNVYRAKGIVTFGDTASRYLFQYAFRESDFMPLGPAADVRDALVFIGEHFSREEMREALSALESQSIPMDSERS